MKIETYLNKLREADHLAASLPKSVERSALQDAIGKKLEQLLLIQHVESTKSHHAESQSNLVAIVLKTQRPR